MPPKILDVNALAVDDSAFLGVGMVSEPSSFNWWASGGPHTEHAEIFRMRGNVFFGLRADSFWLSLFLYGA
jgi:hypothetical protein